MKTLFEFEVLKKVEAEETIVTQEDGKDVKTIKIIEKEIPLKVAIKKPTRELIDEGKTFYAVETSKYYSRGVISAVQLRKRLVNDGGTLSESEKVEFGALYLNFYEKQKEYLELEAKSFDTLTDDEKKRKNEIKGEIGTLTQKISAFEAANSQIFENTVESLARNSSLRFWILNLSYMQKVDDKGITKDEFTPIFGGGNYEAKLKIYDNLEEEADDFYIKSIKSLVHLISHWFSDNANSPEDFKKLYDAYIAELKSNEIESS